MCPNCGYCPHCGRTTPQTLPYWPTTTTPWPSQPSITWTGTQLPIYTSGGVDQDPNIKYMQLLKGGN